MCLAKEVPQQRGSRPVCSEQPDEASQQLNIYIRIDLEDGVALDSAVLMEKLPGLPAQTRPTRTTASRSFTPEGSVALTADKNFALFSPVERTCFTATFCRCRPAGVVIDPFGLKNTVKCRINLQKAAP